MKTSVFPEFDVQRFGPVKGAIVRVFGKRAGHGIWAFRGAMYVFKDAFTNQQHR